MARKGYCRVILITRNEAKKSGITRYYTGKLCIFGHLDERLVSNCQCVTCNRINRKKWSLTTVGKEKIKAEIKRRRLTVKGKAASYKTVKAYRLTENGKVFIKQSKQRYLKKDINRRIAANLRSRLYAALKRNIKQGSAVDALGCSIQEFREHLERGFAPNWSWENWGELWHIDHIKSLATFDLSDKNQFMVANHWTNMRAYSAFDNISEGARK